MLQIGLTIWGIVILVRGEVSLTKKRVVKGTPARVIGGLFASIFPLALAAGFVIGIMIAASGQDPMQYRSAFMFIDFGLMILTVIVAFVIASKYGQSKDQVAAMASTYGSGTGEYVEPLPPTDPNNPFSPPSN